ncbi:ankyrin repeat domain-containing 50-like [Paramuricea clavata]|uniref:Ankyrin repeat domain-containing 50-like n=1 Tax=Paramuricea clavata TaxID=317549 RepID=A0A6S7HWU2_PARCT|nr:ankyrin repeat domain-containing 50-like [Paramuricea clavata]
MAKDPGYHNWLAVGEGLGRLRDSLGKYAENKMKELHALITTNVGGPGVKCHCTCTYGKKPKPHGPAHPHGRLGTPCIWAQELKNHHVFSQKKDMPWHQSVGTHWDDPVHGYWEIAKLFMSDLGQNWITTKDPGSTDCLSLLNLLIFCNHFKIQKNTLNAVKCWRNTWAHSPKRIVTDKEKKDAFTAFDNLMTDPELRGIKEAQDCRQDINKIEITDISILEKKELMIIQFQNQELKQILNETKEEMKETKGKVEVTEGKVEVTEGKVEVAEGKIEVAEGKIEVTEGKVEVTEGKVEVAEGKIEVAEGKIEVAEGKIEVAEGKIEVAEGKIEVAEGKIKETKEEIKLANDKIGVVFITVLLFAVSSFSRNIPGLLWSLMAFFMFSQVGDRSVILDYDCPAAVRESPVSQFQFQEFHFSSYLADKREGFVGRKWFFLDLEKIFEENNETVGVLITGAPGSGKTALMSQLICSPYSSLLIHENIIGYHLCEYSKNGKPDGARFVRNLVDQIAARLPKYSEHVMNDEQIRKELASTCHKDPTRCFFSTIVGPLRRLEKHDGLRFIIIDALDECFGSDLKTSEIMEILNNKIKDFPKWLKVILTSRNVTSVLSGLPQKQITRMPLYSTDERNVDDIREFLRFISQNTDFFKRLLTAINYEPNGLEIFWGEIITRAEGNFLFVKLTCQYMIDTNGKFDIHSLPKSLFDLYDSLFKRQFGEVGFKPFRPLFEVLLAVFSPLPFQDVEEILKIEYKVEDISKRIEDVSCFLRFDGDGTIRIYHHSFSDWLINETVALSMNKTRGHKSIARFLLRRITERHIDVTFEELAELFLHILSGQAFETQETAMDLFNITEIREPQTNQSILHYLVTKPSIYLPVLDFFSQKFQTVDVLDARNKTPAFYAASEGFVKNLQCCIDNGADINSFLEGYTEIDPVSVLVRNTGIEEFSLMHAAAAKGHADVVELLMKRNISFPNTSKNYPTPLHLAAGNGHLEVVKLFYVNPDATYDPVVLHHAAARNHSTLVAFLLHTVRLRDICIPCQPEHFSLLSRKTTIQEAHTYFCETALHAAVSRGLINIVRTLLEKGKESLECKHHSGKTVLMDAVERYDSIMVGLLLRHGASVTTECGRKISNDGNKQMCSMYSVDKQHFLYAVSCINDGCEYGNRAIDISAKYGFWNMAEKIPNKQILIDSLLYDNNKAIKVAVAYDQARFVQNIKNTFEEEGLYLQPRAMIEQAVEYCSTKVASLFLNDPVNYKVENVSGLLKYSVRLSQCEVLKAERVSSNCLKVFQDRNLSEEEKAKKESERRLRIIKLLIKTHQREFSISDIGYDGLTLLHYAARYGFKDAVKYLVKLGADVFLEKDGTGITPLMLAIGVLNNLHPSASYRCYTTNDGQFRSCNTTCQDDVARYLIRLQKLSILKCDNESLLMLHLVILNRMPLSLYALLKVGINVNCHRARLVILSTYNRNSGSDELSQVLQMFQMDVSVKCGVFFNSSELHVISYAATPGDFCNFFQPSFNKKRSPLQRLIDRHPRGVRILDECFDAEGYLPIHRAAQGGNLAAIKWFKSIGVNTQLKTRSGHTALQLSTLLLRNNASKLGINLRYRNECFEELLRTFFDTSFKNYSSDSSSSFAKYPILHYASITGLEVFTNVYKKALEIIPTLKRNKFLILDEQDEYGNTPLHMAVRIGREDVVKHLVRLGADINVKNRNDLSPLWVALTYHLNYGEIDLEQHCYTTNDGLFTSCKTTPHDEIARFLLWLQKTSILKCDATTAVLLNMVISKNMPLSLYALLKISVDVNCQEGIFWALSFEHIREGSEEVSKVLKRFEVNVSVRCGVSFNYSELHLISYVAVPDDFDNFFQPSLNKKRSPLQRMIDRHPRGVRILDECFDAEGYLPIHRAAQGGNLAAIKWFKSIGVNTQLKTRGGFTALDISILYLGNVSYGVFTTPSMVRGFRVYKDIVPSWISKHRNQVFEELLRTFFSTSPEYKSEFPCGSTLEGLSPLHIAAVKGFAVLRYVHKKASESFSSLPINCVNKHQLDPVYLAQFYDSVRSEGLIDKNKGNLGTHVRHKLKPFYWSGIWYNLEYYIQNTQNIDKEFAGGSILSAQYPDREVVFIMAFNYLYHPPPLESTEEQLLSESRFIRISDCPGYYESFLKFEETVSSELPDESECDKVFLPHYYWFICLREVKEYRVLIENCPKVLKQLQSWFTSKQRRNRQLSQLILKILGWSDDLKVSNINNQWPFYFLHKKLLKKYKTYEYLNVLNEALEMSDIRFFS